jgi:hypothetical protein
MIITTIILTIYAIATIGVKRQAPLWAALTSLIMLVPMSFIGYEIIMTDGKATNPYGAFNRDVKKVNFGPQIDPRLNNPAEKKVISDDDVFEPTAFQKLTMSKERLRDLAEEHRLNKIAKKKADDIITKEKEKAAHEKGEQDAKKQLRKEGLVAPSPPPRVILGPAPTPPPRMIAPAPENIPMLPPAIIPDPQEDEDYIEVMNAQARIRQAAIDKGRRDAARDAARATFRRGLELDDSNVDDEWNLAAANKLPDAVLMPPPPPIAPGTLRNNRAVSAPRRHGAESPTVRFGTPRSPLPMTPV